MKERKREKRKIGRKEQRKLRGNIYMEERKKERKKERDEKRKLRGKIGIKERKKERIIAID